MLAAGTISTAAHSPLEGKLHTEPYRWSQVKERGSLWGMRITAWTYRKLGRHVCGALVHAIVAYFFLTDRKGRSASAAYLRRVYSTPAGRATLGGSGTSFIILATTRTAPSASKGGRPVSR